MTGEVAAYAAAVLDALNDGRWHPAVGLGGWGFPLGVRSAALNQLLAVEAVEHDAFRDRFRRVPPKPERQVSIYDEGGVRAAE